MRRQAMVVLKDHAMTDEGRVQQLEDFHAFARERQERDACEIERLREALARAHAVIRKCVTAGVLRADLNRFLSAEPDYAGPSDQPGAAHGD
jgi:hypothetical protein